MADTPTPAHPLDDDPLGVAVADLTAAVNAVHRAATDESAGVQACVAIIQHGLALLDNTLALEGARDDLRDLAVAVRAARRAS